MSGLLQTKLQDTARYLDIVRRITQFTLTVTFGEGGTVSTEGGTFDEGTEVTITATPNVLVFPLFIAF